MTVPGPTQILKITLFLILNVSFTYLPRDQYLDPTRDKTGKRKEWGGILMNANIITKDSL